MAWGQHLILDCDGCFSNIADRAHVHAFVKALVKAIDMDAVGEPIIEYLDPEPRLAGLSVIQLIQTSTITAHFCDATREAYIDVFSCKGFVPANAIEVVREFFKPSSIDVTCIERDAKEGATVTGWRE